MIRLHHDMDQREAGGRGAQGKQAHHQENTQRARTKAYKNRCDSSSSSNSVSNSKQKGIPNLQEGIHAMFDTNCHRAVIRWSFANVILTPSGGGYDTRPQNCKPRLASPRLARKEASNSRAARGIAFRSSITPSFSAFPPPFDQSAVTNSTRLTLPNRIRFFSNMSDTPIIVNRIDPARA